MVFQSMDEMLRELSQYRVYYYQYEQLLSDMDGLRSPVISDEPHSTVNVPKEVQYNTNITEREFLVERMQEIEDCIKTIREVDYLSYVILYDKFILLHTLEDISDMIHYSFPHTRNVLYPKAKDLLFKHNAQ